MFAATAGTTHLRDLAIDEGELRRKLRKTTEDFKQARENVALGFMKGALRDTIRRLAVQEHKEDERLLYRKVQITNPCGGQGIVFKIVDAGFTPVGATEFYDAVNHPRIMVLLDDDRVGVFMDHQCIVIADPQAAADRQAAREFWARPANAGTMSSGDGDDESLIDSDEISDSQEV